MTTPSPREVWYTYECAVNLDGDYVQIPVTNITASIDRDRIPFAMATVEAGWIDDDMFAALDPRVNPKCTYWWIKQWAHDDNGDVIEVGRLPDLTIGNTTAEMWTRTVTRDAINRTTRIELAGGETMMADKKRIAGTTLNTGATTVTALVEWSLIDVFGFYALSSAAISDSTSIPSGDRRNHNPGESHLDLVVPELDAIDCRLIQRWGNGGEWEIIERTQDTGIMRLSTYPESEGAPALADPIVYEFVETASRDGDWADGVLLKFDTTSTGGAVTYQASGLGVNTRGVQLDRQRVETAANAADVVVTRTEKRGYDFTLTARNRFDLDAFDTLIVYTPDTTRTMRIRSIEWDVEASEMRIRAQYGEPEE